MFWSDLDLGVRQWPLALVLLSLLVVWLRRRRLPRCGKAGENMRVRTAMLLLGLGCSSLFIALAVLSQLFPGADEQGVPARADPGLAVLLLAFAALGLPMIVAYLFEGHRLSPGELEYCTLTRRGVLRWSEVKRVRYSRFRGSFCLDATDGRVVRINGMMTGLPLFARIVNDEVAPHKIDPDAQAILDRFEARTLRPL